MERKNKKVIIYLCILCFFLVGLNDTKVFARETGSVNIKAVANKDEGDSYALPDTTFMMYQVAVSEEGRWKLTEDFAKTKVAFDFNDPETQDENAEKLEAYVKKQGIVGERENTDANGEVTFSGLEEGVYLFIQPEKTYLGQSAYQSTAFVIPVPENDGMNVLWNVTVEPKFKNESIPKKGETPQEPTKDNSQKGKRTVTKGGKTGDNTALYQWATILLLSMLVMELIFYRKNQSE